MRPRRRRTAAAARLAPDRAEVRELQAALAESPEWRLDVDLSVSRLGAGLPAWREARVGIARRLDDRWTAAASAEWTERFRNADAFFEGRLDRRFSRGGAYVAFGGVPDADYRPEVSVRSGGELAVGPHLALTLDASWARFGVGDVSSLQPGVAISTADERVRATARWIAVWDERGDRRDGYAASVSAALSDRWRVRLDHADAPETSEGVTVDVRSWALGAEYDVTSAVSVRAGLLVEDRGAYDRTSVWVGFSRRF